VIGKAAVELCYLEREDFKSCMHASEFQSIVNELMLDREIMREKRYRRRLKDFSILILVC
jgi:hypothetical protein